MIATVRFVEGELDLVLASLREHKKNVPPDSPDKEAIEKLISKLGSIRRQRG